MTALTTRIIKILGVLILTSLGLLLTITPEPSQAWSEPQKELNAIKTYLTYYKVDHGQGTAFGNWRTAAWAGASTSNRQFLVDTGYYRAACNTVAAGALYEDVNPNGLNIDKGRLAAIMEYVMQEYSTAPFPAFGGAGTNGWGYYYGNEAQVGGNLHFTNSLVGYPCTLATALTWDYLSNGQKTIARNALESLASRVYQHKPISYYNGQANICGDTKAEEASADASFLAAMSQFDRNHPNSGQWQTRAEQLMRWAVDHLNTTSCPVPPNNVNNHYYNYENTVTNHKMYPYPLYGLSVVNDSARAVLPWKAQGLRPVDVPGGLYGGQSSGGAAISKIATVYNSNIAFINGAGNGYTTYLHGSNFKFKGRTYNTDNFNDYRDFASMSYLGRSGVSEWGIGADFQNGAFALTNWFDMAHYPSPGTFSANYSILAAHQASQTGYGYLPTRHTNGCNGGIATSANGWEWGYLATSCPGGRGKTLVQFFVPRGANSLADQVNTHFFLNSFKAFNHVVGYLYSAPNYWGNGTLPNFR